MKIRILVQILVVLLFACSNPMSVSYQDGQKMADETYGAMAPDQMISQSESVMFKIKSEVEKAENKRQWWDGFCDRGEEIWLDRIDQINSAMGQQILNPGQIKIMFDQMRAGFRE